MTSFLTHREFVLYVKTRNSKTGLDNKTNTRSLALLPLASFGTINNAAITKHATQGRVRDVCACVIVPLDLYLYAFDNALPNPSS